MSKDKFLDLDVLVGLEIHQQLSTEKKLFCSCNPIVDESQNQSFQRTLRPSQSELGYIDPAALFEFKKRKPAKYCGGYASSCLVEADDEPPHMLNPEAVDSALLIALALGATPVDELHVMRKIVIDGSNTSGFQRTMITALNGCIETVGLKIPVQLICLEEDAARVLDESNGIRTYGLDRLCVPLVEIALAPFSGTPEQAQKVALALGRMMRSTGKVMRGLGSIRQDVNISIKSGNVVEVKGVQNLDLIQKVVEFEVKRQKALLDIKEELINRGISKDTAAGPPTDLTPFFKNTPSPVLKKAINSGEIIYGIRLLGFCGLLKYEPLPSFRLGKEFADLVRFYGLGGIFHSDELPAYGVNEAEVSMVQKNLKVSEKDGFILLAGPKQVVQDAADAVVQRAKDATQGVPAETRGPTKQGATKYIRPRPGPARMYPETDIPPIPITLQRLNDLRKFIPKPWEEIIQSYAKKYNISLDLSSRICDSNYKSLFEDIVHETKVQASFIAATLTETLVELSRMRLDLSPLSNNIIQEVFFLVDTGRFSKEAVSEIFETILRKKAKTPQEAASVLGLDKMSDQDASKLIHDIVEKKREIINSKKERSMSIIMGEAMVKLRGKVDGEKIYSIVQDEVNRILKGDVEKLKIDS